MEYHKEDAFEEIKHIKPSETLLIEDMDYEYPENGKTQWRAKISKVNKQFTAMTGYDYILEDWNNTIATLGTDWATTQTKIKISSKVKFFGEN